MLRLRPFSITIPCKVESAAVGIVTECIFPLLLFYPWLAIRLCSVGNTGFSNRKNREAIFQRRERSDHGDRY